MSEQLEALARSIEAHVDGQARRIHSLPDELAYEVATDHLHSVCWVLRDTPERARLRTFPQAMRALPSSISSCR